MIEILKPIIFLLPLLVLLVVSLKSKLAVKEKLGSLIKLSKLGLVLNFIAAIVSIIFIIANGVTEIHLMIWEGLGFSFRLDTLSVIMYNMVAIIAFVVLKFSFNYLDGDARQGIFIGRLSTTIIAVQLMVLSGNLLMLFLAWIATSITLHKLLVFYNDRRKAKLGAKKKFIVARLGDISMFIAFVFIYIEFNTGNLEEVFTAIKSKANYSLVSLEIAAMMLVITAALKSAQLPLHGWLVDVMEAPTPVSALLHAGLLNAGPFLIIRFAYVMDVAHTAPMVLFIIGGLTAVYGSLVFSTQPTIKNSLAYSSIAHMGFTLMVCGLGVYSAALLHLVAHSFYKANAFLTSGSVIDRVRSKNASNFFRKGSVFKMILGILTAALVFAGITYLFSNEKGHEFQLWIIGGIIFMGIVNLLINAFDSNNSFQSILKVIGIAVLVLVSFFILESTTRWILESQLPVLSEPSSVMKYVAEGMLISFYVVALLFSISSSFGKTNKLRALSVHIRNGFYINVLFNRSVGSLNSTSNRFKESTSK